MAVAGGPQAPGLRLWLGVACVASADGSWPVGQDASWPDADLGAGGDAPPLPVRQRGAGGSALVSCPSGGVGITGTGAASTLRRWPPTVTLRLFRRDVA
jgi:hypothetical protein